MKKEKRKVWRPTNESLKDKWWRPTKMTDETIKKLEDWFMFWMTDSEACLYADISMATLYNYQNENPKFLEKKRLLKDNLKMHARLNLGKSIKWEMKDENWDPDLTRALIDSKWYLERKVKDEFSKRSEITWRDWENFTVWVVNYIKPDDDEWEIALEEKLWDSKEIAEEWE